MSKKNRYFGYSTILSFLIFGCQHQQSCFRPQISSTTRVSKVNVWVAATFAQDRLVISIENYGNLSVIVSDKVFARWEVNMHQAGEIVHESGGWNFEIRPQEHYVILKPATLVTGSTTPIYHVDRLGLTFDGKELLDHVRRLHGGGMRIFVATLCGSMTDLNSYSTELDFEIPLKAEPSSKALLIIDR